MLLLDLLTVMYRTYYIFYIVRILIDTQVSLLLDNIFLL